LASPLEKMTLTPEILATVAAYDPLSGSCPPETAVKL
jgi:hypothetical protein